MEMLLDCACGFLLMLCEQCRGSMQQLLERKGHAVVTDVNNGMCLLHAEF